MDKVVGTQDEVLITIVVKPENARPTNKIVTTFPVSDAYKILH